MRVKCVDTEYCEQNITEGNIYKVSNVINPASAVSYFVLIDDDGKECWCNSDRFEILEEPDNVQEATISKRELKEYVDAQLEKMSDEANNQSEFYGIKDMIWYKGYELAMRDVKDKFGIE